MKRKGENRITLCARSNPGPWAFLELGPHLAPPHVGPYSDKAHSLGLLHYTKVEGDKHPPREGWLVSTKDKNNGLGWPMGLERAFS